MKKILVIILFITLTSQTKVLNLQNKDINENIPENIPTKSENPLFGNNKVIGPYIHNCGELGDFYDSNVDTRKILGVIKDFIKKELNQEVNNLIDKDFSFIYSNNKKYFADFNGATNIFIGKPIIRKDIETKIKIEKNNRVLVGSIYMENFLITDIQLQEQERELFDPLSFTLY